MCMNLKGEQEHHTLIMIYIPEKSQPPSMKMKNQLSALRSLLQNLA